MAKQKKEKINVVYSTNPNFNFDYEEEEVQETLAPNQQLLYVSLDRKQRKGKDVTLIEGFIGQDEDLKELAKTLKSACGVGGTAKDGEILIQGDHRNKVIELLEKLGYKYKRKGG
jgi:translation initiation factor 1